MAEPPPLIRDPPFTSGPVAMRTGATRQFLCSSRPKASLQENSISASSCTRSVLTNSGSGGPKPKRREHQETCGPHARPGTGDNSGFATAARIKLARRTVSPEALSGILANLLVLLDHSTFRRFNEPDQHVHVLTAIRLRLQLFQGLCGVAFGGKKNLIRLLNLSNSLL